MTITAFIEIPAGCDQCKPTEPEVIDRDRDIYFTLTPDGQSSPGIFSVNRDGKGLINLISDCEIHSAPSHNKIAYLKIKFSGGKALNTFEINGSTNRTLLDTAYQGIEIPVLSPDAGRIALYAGKNRLILVDTNVSDTNTGNIILLSDNYTTNTLPAFSPDSKYIAFFEGKTKSKPQTPLTLKVMDISRQKPSLVYIESFNSIVWDETKIQTIDWSTEGNLVFALTESAVSDIIYLLDPVNKTTNKITVQDVGAVMPAMSPGRDSVAFASKDGNIYLKTLRPVEKFVKLTNVEPNSFAVFPQWSADGKSILYTRYTRDDVNIYHGVLYVLNLDSRQGTGEYTSILLYNNVYRAFWYRKQ